MPAAAFANQLTLTSVRIASSGTSDGAVAEGVEQLAVGEEPDGRVAEARRRRSAAARRSSCCSRRPTGTTACARGPRSPAARAARTRPGRPTGTRRAAARAGRGSPRGSSSPSSRATIAPLSEPWMPYARVPEPAHERVVGARRPGRSVQPASTTGLAEAVAGRVGDHDVERVLGAAAVGDRVDERVDHVEVVDGRPGVGVREQQRRRARVRRAHVDEVDRLARRSRS